MSALTLRQRILLAIQDYHDRTGVAPSIREVCAAVGSNSTSNVNRHLHILRSTGWLAFEDGKLGTLRLLRPIAEVY